MAEALPTSKGRVQPTLISLFAGAGGTEVGLERAGWDTVVATDANRDCVASLKASRDLALPVPGRPGKSYLQDAHIFQADVRDLQAKHLRPTGRSTSWRPSLLAGGPPCQPWSSAGHQRGLNDPRGQLLDHMIRLSDELRPRFIFFENVQGLVTAVGPSGEPGEVFQYLKARFEELGYATTFALLNSADYGAAQRRVRLYMLATEKYSLPDMPLPTHSKQATATLFETRKPWITLRELLAGLPAPEPSEVVVPGGERAEQLAALVPGTGLRTGGVIENNRPSGHWGYRQDSFLADLDLPSRTIRAASTPDWIRLPDGSLRRLTWRECAALQGFPYEWEFVGTVASKFRQIGNAVQADVVEALGQALLTALAAGPSRVVPSSAPLPPEFHRRVRYTRAEHRTNGAHRVRVKVRETA